MDSLAADVSDQTTKCITANIEVLDPCSKSSSGSGKGHLIKGKSIDIPPPFPPNVKRLRPTTSADITQGSSEQSIMEANQIVDSDISYGPRTSNEVEDVSTESDELPTDGHETESNVTRDFIRSVEKSPSSNNCSAEYVSFMGNKFAFGGSLNGDKGMGKACSCSFCIKAAHMWADITFQDTKGKLTELHKSKKRTKDYIAKVMKDPLMVSKSSKLENDLLQHWTTLFEHTRDALDQEISQTQSKLEAQSKLVESCKKELEKKSDASTRGP